MTNNIQIDQLSRIHGFIDAIHSRNKPELIVDAATLCIDRLLNGDGERKSGQGDISLLQRLNTVIRGKTVSGNSAVKKAWAPFLQSLTFLRLDNELNVIGQETSVAIAASVFDKAHYRKEFERFVEQAKTEASSKRTKKTDAERFIALGEKLGLNLTQLEAMVQAVTPVEVPTVKKVA